jgi:hypothetical protein
MGLLLFRNVRWRKKDALSSAHSVPLDIKGTLWIPVLPAPGPPQPKIGLKNRNHNEKNSQPTTIATGSSRAKSSSKRTLFLPYALQTQWYPFGSPPSCLKSTSAETSYTKYQKLQNLTEKNPQPTKLTPWVVTNWVVTLSCYFCTHPFSKEKKCNFHIPAPAVTTWE